MGDYSLGAIACAIAGLPWAMLSVFLHYALPDNYADTTSMPLHYVLANPMIFGVLTILEVATLGLILEAVFVKIRDRIPTKQNIGKAIVFMLTVWLVSLLIVWLVIVIEYVVPGRFLYPSPSQLREYISNLLTGLGIFVLWGATFGYIFNRPKLVKRIDFIHPRNFVSRG